MSEQYRDPNKRGKRNNENGYENRRGVDMIANMFGGLFGKARDAKRKHKEKLENQ